MIAYRVLSCAALVTLLQSGVYAATMCQGASTVTQLTCLERNFDDLYSQDYARFWKILNKAKQNAEHCRSVRSTAQFLGLARIQTGNAEFKEFLAQSIEDMCIHSSPCFQKASRLVDLESRSRLEDMLATPMFATPDELRRAGCLEKGKK